MARTYVDTITSRLDLSKFDSTSSIFQDSSATVTYATVDAQKIYAKEFPMMYESAATFLANVHGRDPSVVDVLLYLSMQQGKPMEDVLKAMREADDANPKIY